MKDARRINLGVNNAVDGGEMNLATSGNKNLMALNLNQRGPTTGLQVEFLQPTE